MEDEMLILKKKGGRPSKRPEKEVFEKLYQKHSTAEIAYLYDVPVSTVRTWVHYFRKEQVM